jgi:hypothetical protein
VFATIKDPEAGISALMASGFREEDISVLLADNRGVKDFAHEKHSKAPEGATVGATAGAVVGGTLGLLAGIGALSIPGLGVFIAAGPLMGALAGIGSVGVAGGIVGAIVGIGMPEFEAKRYAGLVKEGRTLLSVHCDNSDWVARAQETLEVAGAQDIAETGEADADFAAVDPGLRYGTR